jgi:hypothetical protein
VGRESGLATIAYAYAAEAVYHRRALGRMIVGEDLMNSHRAGSVVLLAGGLFLVFAGLISAFGFSLGGVAASTAAIAALLYAGGVWFGQAPRLDPSVVLFTPTLAIAAGPFAGRQVSDPFPGLMRADIDAHCREALAGGASRFTCGAGAASVSFSATPVREAGGAIIYGLLLSGAVVADAIPASVV